MCTVEKRGNVFILTLTGEDEHRLNPTLINSIRSALANIRSQSLSSPSAALVTTATGKFFSNGLDLNWVQFGGSIPSSHDGSGESMLLSTSGDRLLYVMEALKSVVGDLLSLPMPTIAAVSGHAAAGGFILALSHDYLFMRKDKGVLYMSELDIGMAVVPSVLFQEKIGFPVARREIMLRATKVKADEGVRLGIVDEAFSSVEEMVEAAVRLGEKLASRKWNGEVYAEIRKGLYPESCKELGLERRELLVFRPKL